MRRVVALSVAVGLMAGILVGPVDAAKRKKPKKPGAVATPVNYWFHNHSTEANPCSDDATFTLKLTEATEGGNCGNGFYGASYEAANAAGVADPYTYNAIEGIPFVLDARRKITGSIWVTSRGTDPAFLGVGQATMIATISGEVDGETVELGTIEANYTVTPAQADYEIKIDLQPPADKDKAIFTALSISLHNEGPSVNHGYYRTHSPASFLMIPTWK